MNIKKYIKSKTILFNAFIAVGAVIETNFEFIKTQMPDTYMYFVIGITFINFYLRSITTESLDKKVKDE